ncbi:uncharacterized protein LOC101856220 [Aplysia californica]|uniref:Uncharacterized protein LOC101856220 n=1 Tax=Aplysia californica TaxID=6500 RepID=A0ABM1ABB3_APLCA|nr:uncharacterized protein LOC101856220 [Aplysia californica]
MSPFPVLFILGFALRTTLGLSGTSPAASCDYQGIAAATFASSTYCNGVIFGGKLLIPDICGTYLDQLNKFGAITVYYADGAEKYELTSYSATTSNGITSVDLPGFSASGCFQEATLYDKSSHTLDPSTCVLASYGGTSATDTQYDGTLETVPLTKVTGVDCCKTLYPTLKNELNTVPDSSVPLNCVTSTGAACGLADTGAPIYCDTTTGQKVVTGLTASTTCDVGGTTLVLDLSDADPDFKFGY